MSKWIAGHTCAAAVLAVAMVGAQSQPEGQGTPRSTTGQGTMTLSGCVTNSAGTGGSAAVPAPGAAPMIILTTSGDAASAPRNETAGTSGSSPTASTAARGTQYRLSGSTTLDQYVGKRVEVVGSRNAASGTAAGAPSTPGATAGAATPSEFRVTSVRVLDESCN